MCNVFKLVVLYFICVFETQSRQKSNHEHVYITATNYDEKVSETNGRTKTLLLYLNTRKISGQCSKQNQNRPKEHFNVFHQSKDVENAKKMNHFGNSETTKLSERGNYINIYDTLDDLLTKPDLKVKSLRTISYSYEELIPLDKAYIDGGDLGQEGKNKISCTKTNKRDEKCFQTMKNEIANLFDDDLNISKTIFPLCCKSNTRPKCLPKTTKSVTDPKLEHSRITTTLKEKSTAKPTWCDIPVTSVHQTISNEAVVNVVVHVKCDHPEAKDHALPKGIFVSLSPESDKTKCLPNHSIENSKTYGIAVSLLRSKTTEITTFLQSKSTVLTESSSIEQPLVKQYERNGANPCGQRDSCLEMSHNNGFKNIPKPLLPHDITINFTTPVIKPKETVKPVFICNITPTLCRKASKKLYEKRLKPGLTVWQKIKIPHFWQSTMSITQSNRDSEVEESLKNSLCSTKEVECQITESEKELGEISCITDKKTTTESTIDESNCYESESLSIDIQTPQQITYLTVLNSEEQTDPSMSLENVNCVVSDSNPTPTQYEPESIKTALPLPGEFSLYEEPAQASTELEEPVKLSKESIEIMKNVGKPFTEPFVKTYTNQHNSEPSAIGYVGGLPTEAVEQTLTESGQKLEESNHPYTDLSKVTTEIFSSTNQEHQIIEKIQQPVEPIKNPEDSKVHLTESTFLEDENITKDSDRQSAYVEGLSTQQYEPMKEHSLLALETGIPPNKSTLNAYDSNNFEDTLATTFSMNYISTRDSLQNERGNILNTEPTIQNITEREDLGKHTVEIFSDTLKLNLAGTETNIKGEYTHLVAATNTDFEIGELDQDLNEKRISTLNDLEHSTWTTITSGATDNGDITLNYSDQMRFSVSGIVSTDIRNIIDLGAGKYQFYWRGRWFITDKVHVWPFEDQTNTLMNETFFGLQEDKTASLDSINELLIHGSYESLEMPFEFFSLSILRTAKFSANLYYIWGRYKLSYSDIIAMLRLTNFNFVNLQNPDLVWGQINWHVIYEKLQNSPRSTADDRQAYEVVDYDGSKYPLIIFSNGTSIWKHSILDLNETLSAIELLNGNLYFPDAVVLSPSISYADTFESFLTDVISDRMSSGILHSSYIWKNYEFTWEELEAINRNLLKNYESKLSSDLSFSKIAMPILNSKKERFPSRTVFEVPTQGAETWPLIVYPDGTTEYENVRLGFADTVKQVKELKESSKMVFVEDWDKGQITTTVKDNNSKVFHDYDWGQLNNNPYNNVCYPINLGGGKVQFYMKNTWFITDGQHFWPFEHPLTNFYINEMVKSMDKTFTDDPKLDKSVIQTLVNNHISQNYEDLLMPHELLIHHHLYFMSHIDPNAAQSLSKDTVYKRDNQQITSVHLLIALRLSAYNNFTTAEVELPWEKGKKLNWDWLYLLARKSERKLTESITELHSSNFDGFHNTPTLIVNNNLSTDWGSQHLEVHEALNKVQKANERYVFLPVEVNGEFKLENEAFEKFYKEALLKRLESNKTHLKYKWSKHSLSWYEMLIAIRYPEMKPESVYDNSFWSDAIRIVTRAPTTSYIDRIEYKVNGIGSNEDLIVAVYMNESTILNGRIMDILEYRTFL